MFDFIDDHLPWFMVALLVVFIAGALYLTIVDQKEFDQSNVTLKAQCLQAGQSEWDCTKFIQARIDARSHDQAIEASAVIVSGAVSASSASGRR